MKNFQEIVLPDISDVSIPMAYPSGQKKLPVSGLVLAADVGGTKTELALFQIKEGKLLALKNQRYATTDHQSFIEAIRNFHDEQSSVIDCACLGVAGTVDGDKVKGVNFTWEIDAKKIASDLRIKTVLLINDLQANAYGLSALDDSDFEIIAKGEKDEGNAVVISPGTGLGEAGMFWDGTYYHPYATEGGHCNFAPSNELDAELWKFLKNSFEHVSWERLISGQGILNIYQFLRSSNTEKEPEWLTEQLKIDHSAKTISAAAIDKKDPVCIETMQLFFKYLAIESSQLALKTKATGGIFIGGGIVPKNLSLIDKKEFYKTFINTGRMEHLLKNIPVKIVLNDKTALMGAAYYAAMGISN
ncbi:glucokinase [Chryseobacterium sp. RG1]|uniref:Glucokinase n=1 Tax=Chryseobacterium tagetis TaxID=2801334 RepID=A0ABS8A1V1_9FLAO|nr:glucokinase [Chryseobacterium tagetis]MCA6067946.1 glucokinase [Chryseobacterium tagetis]